MNSPSLQTATMSPTLEASVVPDEHVMYIIGEVFNVCEAVVVEVVLPSRCTTSLKSEIFWPVESRVAM